jgi:uncharacterized protein (TIGR02466 family)
VNSQSEYNVTPLFAIPLFKSNLGNLNPITRAWLMNLEFLPQRTGHDGTDDHLPINQRGMHILDKPQLKNLKAQIKKTLDFFVHETLSVEDHIEFEIQTSWVNQVDDQNSVPIHGHNNSMISGVYYVEVDKMSAPLMFEKNYLYTNLFHRTVMPTFKEKNQFNTDLLSIQPIPGDLYLFPSHLEHSVPSGFGANRVSLAFNCFARGNFGLGTDNLKI